MFEQLRIPPELVELAGIERVSNHDARETYGIKGGGDMAGIVFPYFDPESMTNGRRRHYARIRRDHPEMEDGKAKKKYVAPYGDPKHFYFPPCPELFADLSVPIVLVEAEKSALALLAWSERVGRKLLPLAMGGCWGWRGKVGIQETAAGDRVPEHGAIRDLNICRDGRLTYILLDANCATNPAVETARKDFQKFSLKRGKVILNAGQEHACVEGRHVVIREGDPDGVQHSNSAYSEIAAFVIMTRVKAEKKISQVGGDRTGD